VPGLGEDQAVSGGHGLVGAGGGADGAGRAGNGVGSGGVPALLAVLRGRAWTLALRYRAFGGVCRHAGLCFPATASGPAVTGSGEDDIADPV
jgi:hypothetical protein